MSNDLMIIDENKAAEIFGTDENKIDPIIEKIEKEVRSFHLDISTPTGRKEIASLAHKVARTKTALDGMGKGLTDEARKKIGSIDAERRHIRERLDALKEEVRKPLTEYEDKEKGRIKDHEDRLNEMAGLLNYMHTPNSSVIKDQAIKLRELYQHDWEEFAQRAEAEFNQIDQRLSQMLEKLEKQEAEQAELERLRKANEERERKERDEGIARDAAEKAKLEAEEKAREEREAAEAKVKADKEEVERKAQAEREAAERQRIEDEERIKAAEQAKKDAEAKAKQDAEEAVNRERQRIEDEQKAEVEATKKREANKKHRASINNQALKCLIDHGLSENDGKKAIEAIAKGEVKNVSISY